MLELVFAVLVAIGIGTAGFYLMRRRGWMRNGYFTIGTSLLIALLVMIVYQTLGAMLLFAVRGAEGLSEINAPWILLTNAVAQIAILVGGTYIIIRATDQDLITSLRLEGLRETPLPIYIIAAPLTLLAQFVGQLVSVLWIGLLKHFPGYETLRRLQDESDRMMADIVTAHSIPELILVLLLVAIVPAVAEEVFFRGLIQTNIERSGYRRSRPYVALLITSLVFSLGHVSIFKLPGLLALGLIMGYMSYRTNNLLVGSFAHAFNNGLIVLLLFLYSDAFTGTEPSALLGDPEAASVPELLLGLLLFVPFLVIGLLLFHRWTEPLRAREYADEEVRATTAYYDALELRQLGYFPSKADVNSENHQRSDERL
jgi:membrane protease YdiL (CAAX protease family)